MIIWWRACAFVAVVSAFVAGTVALLAPEAPRGPYETLLRVLCWVAGALMLGWAASHVRAVLEEQRVFGARVAPLGPRPQGPRASVVLIGSSALALAVPVACLSMVLAAPPGAATPVSLLAAAGAALATAGLLHALAWIGLLAWWGRVSPRWLVPACAPLGLLAWGWDGVLQGVAQSPWLVPPACVAAAAGAMLVWRALWPTAPGARASAAPVPRARAAALARRLQASAPLVDNAPTPIDNDPTPILLGMFIAVSIKLAWSMEPKPGSLSFAAWGSPFALEGAVRIALMAALMGLGLRMGALHWRRQLAPGGRIRRTLGAGIVLRTWLTALAVLGQVCLALAVLAWLVWPQALDKLLGLASRFGPTLLCELLLATAVAAWLRPLAPHPHVVPLAFAAVAGIIYAAAGLLAWSGHAAVLPAWPTGTAHHLGLLLLAAGFTLLANGSWRRADLRRITGPQPGLGEAWRQIVASLRPAGRGTPRGQA
jgi:hypothetical protein